jgi:hypothetical protein
MPAPGTDAFSYAILRIVPAVERGERINAGVVLFCRRKRFLGARVALDEARLRALSADTDPGMVRRHLEGIVRVAEGDSAAGPIAALPQSERFGWLTAPASTMVQPSEVHTGLCEDPADTLDALFDELVA